MGRKKAGKHSFASLDALFRIIQKEQTFRVQIITLESLDVLEAALAERGIEYVRQFSSDIRDSTCVTLILQDSDVDVQRAGRHILFSNVFDGSFVQIVFRPTREEKLAVVGDERLVQAYDYKSISELTRMQSNTLFRPSMHFGSELDYFESIVMLVVATRARFHAILDGVREMDAALNNAFVLQMKLNGLVSKQFVLRTGDSYRSNVSEETVRAIGRRAGFQ